MKPPPHMLGYDDAAAVEAKFEYHRSTVRNQQDLAPPVDAHAIMEISKIAFWASLRREEDRTPRVSVAFLPPERAEQALRFARPLALTSAALTQLAPAVERPGIHLAIWFDDGKYYLWGVTRLLPDLCFVLEVLEPGLLVIKYSRSRTFGKYGNVAVLEGDLIKIVDEQITKERDFPLLLTSLVGLYPSVPWLDDLNLLIQLATSMRAHGRGGLLLIVPNDEEGWRESIIWPMPYTVGPSFTRLADLTNCSAEERGADWQLDIRNAVEGVAGLTAVDGATVMNSRHDVLAFGAMIKRANGGKDVEQLELTEPIEGYLPRLVEPGEVGHSRHLAAAQFVHDQHQALALVASQDGRFTIFSWSDDAQLVHAYRIDTLLM